MKRLFLFILLALPGFLAEAQSRIKGKIISARDSSALPGASIRIKGTMVGTSSAVDGTFTLLIPVREAILEVAYLGYHTIEVPVTFPTNETLLITLSEDAGQLQEVVVSTGYQEIPAERATGSFVQIDHSLLNRSVSTDILSRLQDVVPGLIFNRSANSTNDPISIRGRSTISSSPTPLIVIDNFPWEGDIESLNPNDVESITVLKDAAAASIWGARSGNGVIVITTKKGKYRQPARVSFNSNVNVSGKPDLFYQPAMSSSDYIEIEKRRFASGLYTATEASVVKAPLTPVVELLIAKRDGTMSADEANAQIEALKNTDVRDEFRRYLYRPAVNQQYSISLTGGGENQRYFVSGGYDHTLNSQNGNSYSRVTLNLGNTYLMFKDKLELTAGIYYTGSTRSKNAVTSRDLYMSPTQPLYPYARLADSDGSHLATVQTYRSSFAQNAVQQGLLDWEYRPLDEAALNDESMDAADYRINTGLMYKLPLGLQAEILYQYSRGTSDSWDLNNSQCFFARNMINNLTVINSNGSLTRPIPIGSIMDMSNSRAVSHDLRGQVNYDRTWKKNGLAVLAGSEVRDRNVTGVSSRLYGYDEEHAISGIVDPISSFKRFVNPAQSVTIPVINSQSDLSDRFLSWYLNSAYTYNSRYTLSVSGRFDQSNLFGVSANQKGVPLYSIGTLWNLSEESFYKLAWLPSLKLRLTYGYNGNVNKEVSAYTTASYNNGNSTPTRQPYATVQNPPNPDLRWERIRIMNAALDFSAFNDALSGSIDYYRKTGFDLIGTTPFPPSSGISSFTGNYANTKGQGVDIQLNSRNLNGTFRWHSSYLFSVNKDEVTSYKVKGTALNFLENTGGPLEGKPLYAIYGYGWAGLNAQTGDPQGYLAGNVSTNYAGLRDAALPESLVYHGSARPQLYGALRNTFTWRHFTASANISYRLGYYFRRGSIRYAADNGLASGHGDYALRWQNPGDELVTNVPSIPAATNANRDNFYRLSSALVEKGDHIRFNDFSLGYTLTQDAFRRLPVKSIQFNVYASNLGILWKASRINFDPDYPLADFPPIRSIAFVLRAGF